MRRGVYAGGGLVLALSLALSACGGGAAQPHASVPPLTSASSTPVAIATATAPATPPASGVPPTGAPVGSSSPTAASPTGVASSGPADPGPSAYPATKAGAAAIAKAYYEALISGARVNSVDDLRRVATPDCPCLDKLNGYVQKAIAAGTHAAGGNLSAFSVNSYRLLSPTRALVVATVAESASQVVDGKGIVRARAKATGHTQAQLVMVTDGGTWRIEQTAELSR